ncbi:hypothetical protein D0525_24515 [Salmonella enterica]|uniref:hypothetical protein n=1 Tax=Salmonella enterica TaxID=28901 RepID=UPI00101274CE|nr:hypothetical protein [Salmonella enterica]RXO30028.1 hypothetical protein D0525_24515 [Salmonella enterica]
MAIDQIAQSGLSSLKVIYYSAQLFSWAKGERPYVGENGKEFAKRLMDKKYGEGGWDAKGARSEHNKIQKWGDRGFENPK